MDIKMLNLVLKTPGDFINKVISSEIKNFVEKKKSYFKHLV